MNFQLKLNIYTSWGWAVPSSDQARLETASQLTWVGVGGWGKAKITQPSWSWSLAIYILLCAFKNSPESSPMSKLFLSIFLTDRLFIVVSKSCGMLTNLRPDKCQVAYICTVTVYSRTVHLYRISCLYVYGYGCHAFMIWEFLTEGVITEIFP